MHSLYMSLFSAGFTVFKVCVFYAYTDMYECTCMQLVYCMCVCVFTLSFTVGFFVYSS